MTNLSRSLVLGCSLLALAACGPEEIVSPGTGGNVTINNITNNPAPTPTPTPTPTPAAVTPAAGCPTIPDQDPVASGTQGLVDEGTITGPEGTWRVCALPSRFNASATLVHIPGLLYRLPGRVDIGLDRGPAPTSDPAVVLTIEPGVIVYGSGAAWLNANRGNRLIAVGTQTRPIIFTSRDNVLGINNANSSGQWGGVVLSGRAPVTDCIAPGATPGTVACERQVEGAVDPALFGGATNNDNSGRLEYVQIRYSGFVLSGDAELQSLTTGGTGSGTQIRYIQSVNSSDDGVEFFGGFVNLKNLIVAGAEDDGLDADTGAKVNLQYVVVAQRSGVGDSTVELDTTNGLQDQTPRTNLQVVNATMIHRNTLSAALRLRGGADFALANSLFVENAPAAHPCLRVDDALTMSAANAGLDKIGPPRFRSNGFECRTLSTNGSGGGATAAEAAALITGAGLNNNASFTNSLTAGYLNGNNENTFSPLFDVTTLSSFFDASTFIGAVNASANWTTGWTCDSAAVTFGNNTGSCLRLPVFPAA